MDSQTWYLTEPGILLILWSASDDSTKPRAQNVNTYVYRSSWLFPSSLGHVSRAYTLVEKTEVEPHGLQHDASKLPQYFAFALNTQL